MRKSRKIVQLCSFGVKLSEFNDFAGVSSALTHASFDNILRQNPFFVSPGCIIRMYRSPLVLE